MLIFFIRLAERLTRTYARPWLGLRINSIDKQNDNLNNEYFDNKKPASMQVLFSAKTILVIYLSRHHQPHQLCADITTKRAHCIS